jgi:S1-C subfamily serine protease
MPPLKQIIPQLRSAIVQVIFQANLPNGQPIEAIAGTGFFVADLRYIATAAHVIRDTAANLQQQGASSIQFNINVPIKDFHVSNVRGLMGFFRSPVEVVDIDQDNDLALLRAPQPIGPKGIRPSIKVDNKEVEILEVSDVRFFGGNPEVGEEIAVAGFPLSTPYLIVQSGIISALPVLPVPNSDTARRDCNRCCGKSW